MAVLRGYLGRRDLQEEEVTELRGEEDRADWLIDKSEGRKGEASSASTIHGCFGDVVPILNRYEESFGWGGSFSRGEHCFVLVIRSLLVLLMYVSFELERCIDEWNP